MQGLTDRDMLIFVLELAILLVAARTLGEVFRALRQPPIVGEILGGILVGPTVFGRLLPGVFSTLFPNEPLQRQLLDAVSWLGAMSLLLVAGMEVDVRMARRQGRPALLAALFGFLIPFALGLALGAAAPSRFHGEHGQRALFALFMGTALAITALPVVARILMDLNLLNTDVGLTILTAAMLQDLAGWVVLSVISVVATTGAADWRATGTMVLWSLLFYAFCLTLGVTLVNRLAEFAEKHLPAPGGILTTVAVITLLCGAVTQAIGTHVVFGAFIAGVMLGEVAGITQATREAVKDSCLAVAVPVFFASVGLKVDLLTTLDLKLFATVLALACVGKFAGGSLGAWLGGMSGFDALSVAVGMNARGAMEIILAMIGMWIGIEPVARTPLGA
jgi:Kef-type K+ transport system membrane component KefB